MNGAPDQRLNGAPSAFEAPRLAVTRLILTNFRSYASGALAVSGRPVVLAGPNGAGKTNILDAISLLSPGRGLRGATLGEHARKGPSAPSDALWAVAATVSRSGELYEIGTGLTLGPNGGERRKVHLNGAPSNNAADLADVVQMAWLTPAMDRLFIEGASGRRKFLDRLVFGFTPEHARNAVRYETAMRERARLLKYGPRDPAWLDGLETEMTETGIAIAAARAEGVVRLNKALESRGLAGAFPSAHLALVGDADTILAESADAIAEFRDHFAHARIRDAEAGRTTFGPHRSDLAVRHVQKRTDAADCSTGEQKALLIAIVLAHAWESSHIKEGRAPVLLLDEIAAHLDSKRRAALFEEILALGAQAWMTGTDIEMFAPLKTKADLFAVADSQAALISE
ncbi:MAG TPA: DNA replication/repair protein RecF [Rhizomicrobium sp.]|nr:DNA replication/repair protein RecF [Rhizomicrobium sp.]